MGTVFVIIILIAAVALVIRKMIADHKAGKSSCGCSCGSCGHCSGCAQAKK